MTEATTEVTGRGILGASDAVHLVNRLGALSEVTLAPEFRWRARPRGIEDGFDAGADADRTMSLDGTLPTNSSSLGEDLISLEVELEMNDTSWVLAVTARRDHVGPIWSAHLDCLSGDTPLPSWWPSILDGWGRRP